MTKKFESQQNWFKSWFNRSPWSTTLISAITGPTVILMLILTIGSCIFNRILQFMKDRLSVIQALILTYQYQDQYQVLR